MIGIYTLITFKFLPKIVGSIILAVVSVIFFIVLMVVIVKNIRLYRIDRSGTYYQRDNPLFMFKKKCIKPSYIEGSNSSLESLIDVLTNNKNIAIEYEEYGEAQRFHMRLVYIYYLYMFRLTDFQSSY